MGHLVVFPTNSSLCAIQDTAHQRPDESSCGTLQWIPRMQAEQSTQILIDVSVIVGKLLL